MKIYIDNKELKAVYGIAVLDHTPAFGVAAERIDNRVWADKSGVDKNRSNVRLDAREFTLECICKATNELAAFALVKALCDYMFSKGCFVLSLRGAQGRYCLLCERNADINPTVNIRQSDSLYVFRLGLRDVNPNALKFYKTLSAAKTVKVAYDKGQPSDLYYGDGRSGAVSNSQSYVLTDYTGAEGDLVDVIIDVDANAVAVAGMAADFTYSVPTGIVPEDVQFTDTSTGSPVLWSWDFGDGTASAEQSPIHTYTTDGVYTVTLQVFNSAQGSATVTKTNIITLRRGRRLKDSTGGFRLINNTNYLLKS